MGKYKLEPDENFMEFAGRFGVNVTALWDDIENTELRRARKHFWYVSSGDEVVVPEELVNKRKRMPSGEAKKFIQGPHPNIIDVHLGFMDEEVNARLAKLIEKEGKEDAKKRRPVILIERGKLSIDDPILEWRLGNYPIDGKKNPIRTIVHVSPQGTLEWLEQGKKVRIVKLETDFGIKWKIWQPRHAWLEDKAEGLTRKEMSLAPENILARAMGVYMEQEIPAEQTLKEFDIEYTRAFDIVEFIAHRGHPKTKSKLPKEAEGGEGPWLSVVRFDIGPDTCEKEEDIRPPLIFIRTPEMGLQPSLMKPYVEFLFKSISLMASQLAAEKVRLQDPAGEVVTRQVWEWPLKVFQYGAQGSCSLSSMLLPGKQVVVIASLYVGYDIDKNGDVWSVISLCTPAGVYDYLRTKIAVSDKKSDIVDQYMDPKAILDEDQKDEQAWVKDARGKISYSFKSRYEEWPFKGLLIPKVGKAADDLKNKIEFAQEIAASIFHTQASEDQWKRLKIVKAHKDPNGPYSDIEKEIGTEEAEDGIWTLKKTIERIYHLYKDKFSEAEGPMGIVTGTFSYFGGEKDKDASNKLGIYGANMEDYHILRVLRNAFCQGIWESTNYPIILGWRIDRIQCDPKEIPATVIEKFKTFAQEDESRLTKEGYIKVIIWGLRGVLKSDIEANKGLKDTIYWKFLKKFEKMEDVKKYFWSFVRTEDLDKFWVPDPFYVEIATDFVKDLSEMNPGIDDFRPGPNITKEEIKRKAKKILDAWKKEQNNGLEAILKPDSATYLAVADLMEDLSKCGFSGGAGRMKTWLRPGKWSQAIQKSTLQDAFAEFDGAAVDRAFYKSSNVMALQTMAAEFRDVFTPLQV